MFPDLSEKIKEISISEFFEKNRHLLGYENPSKAFYTVVKELVDNSIDACLEARILPEIYVKVKKVDENRMKVRVEDNGPGISPKKLPIAFGKFLVGSKFYRLRQSVWKNEILPIKINGRIRFVKIGEFINKFIKDEEGVVNVENKGIEVLSFNPQTLKLEWSPVSHLIKHVNDEELFEVETETGKKIRVTGSHSLFVLTKNGIESKHTIDLKEGDYLVAARRLPTLDTINEINLLDFLSEGFLRRHRYWIEGVDKKIFEKIRNKAEKIRRGKRLFYKIDDFEIRSDYLSKLEKKRKISAWIVKKFGLEDFAKKGRLISYNREKKIKLKLLIRDLEGFGFILGWYIADGDISERVIRFDLGKDEENIARELKRKIKRIFGLNVSIRKESSKIRLSTSSTALIYSLRKMGVKTDARRKEIPWIVFNLPRDAQISFIKSLLKWGSHISSSKNNIVFVTSSKKVAFQLHYLLLMNDIYSSLSYSFSRGGKSTLKKKRYKRYRLYIFSREMNKLFNVPKRVHSSVADKLPTFLLEQFSNKWIMRYERISREKFEDYIRLGYRKSSKRYFSILESFFNGIHESLPKGGFLINRLESMGIIDKNLDLTSNGLNIYSTIKFLKNLVSSDLCFLKIKKIRRIKLKKKEYVYDISVPGKENFVCGLGIVCHNSIGSQGIGAKGAILYSQLTTNKPARIWSATINSKEVHYFELMIDVLKNEPLILKHEVKENKNWHGTIVELEFEGKYTSKVDEYLELIWLVNPYVRLVYEKDEEKKVYERVTNNLPPLPKEIKPHPYGIEIGILKRLILQTKSKTLLEFLTSEFSRIGKDTAKKIIRLAKIYDEIEISDKTVEEYLNEKFKENSEKIIKIAEDVERNKKLSELSDEERISLSIAIALTKDPKELKNEEIEKLFKAMQKVKVRAPPTDCLSPIDEKYLLQALKKIFKAEVYSIVTRKPSVYRGFPFQVQAAIVYGLKELRSDEEIQNAKILRFANHTPLLYNLYDCAITKAIMQINWNSYGISQSGNLPNEPMVIIVDFLSVWIPFKSEGKQAIAEYPEILREIKLALQEAARKVYRYILKKRKYEILKEKRNIFERYIPEVAKELSKVTNVKEEILLHKLKEIADKKVPELFKIEEEIKS